MTLHPLRVNTPAPARWELSWRADPRGRRIADRHYNRQKVGSPQLVPPGGCLVLVAPDSSALWVTSTPLPEYVKHEWAGAWVCSAYRNEGPHLASEAIRAAVAHSLAVLGPPPALGMVTFVDPRKVAGFIRRRRRDVPVLEWGYSFQKAGFRYCGWTKGGLFALRLDPSDMPSPQLPSGAQPSLWGGAHA